MPSTSSNSNDVIIKSITSAIFQKMLDDVLLDIGQKAHKEVYRSKTVCNICHTRCRSVHPPASSTGLGDPSSSQTQNGNLSVPGASQQSQGGVLEQSAPPSRPTTPLSSKPSGTQTPNGSSKSDILLDCMVCKRSIASNRYAPHLASCLGLGTGSRRTGGRTAATKTKLNVEVSRSNSPQVGAAGDELPAPPPARKGRPPKNAPPKNSTNKKKGAHSATPEVSANGKRPASPAQTPPKNAKRHKSNTASPSLSAKTLPTSTLPPNAPGSAHKAKIPSRLRSSPTAPPSSSASSAPVEMDFVASPTQDSQSQSSFKLSPTGGGTGTPDSIYAGVPAPISRMGSSGAKTVPGKTAPPGYLPPRTMVPMSVTAHNDPDYVAVDADDLADTDSDEGDEDGDDD